MIGRVNYVVFVASEQSILKFWKKFFAEQFFAGLIFADFQKIAKSAKNKPPRKKWFYSNVQGGQDLTTLAVL